jgi:folate-binding protein YgfZ
MAEPASEVGKTGVLAVRESERGVLSVRGPERATWLNGVVTPDVATLPVGQGVFGLLLSKQGKIHTDFALAVDAERLLLAVSPGTAGLALSELERMLVMEDAEIADISGELECLSLHGARGVELARAVASELSGTAAELDRTGPGGALLFVKRGAGGEATAALARKGAVLLTEESWLELRLERGIGLFGVDYGPSDNPHEAALDRVAVSWSKGCYLGQEAVFMQDARGKLKRRLSLLAIAGPPPAPGSRVSAAGDAVGEVTSAALAADGSRALARVRAPHFEPGTALSVLGVPAVVLARPV